MADTDPQLELKKRARRRLVGAIALAVLAAAILPVVMDKEPRPSRVDLQVRIPSQEGANFASQPIQGREAPPPLASSPELAEAQTAASAPLQSSAAAALEHVPAELAEAAASAAEPPLASEPSLPSPSPSPSPSEVPTVAATPAPQKTPPPRRDDAQRAAALLGEKVEEAHSYVVQLGVFKDSANALSARNAAKSAGVKTYSETAGAALRVRAGPFSTREAAEKAAAKLRRAGLQAVIQVRP